MAYKPKTLKSNFVRGKSGVALVAFSPDGKKVKVTFKDDEKSFIVPMTDCPDEMQKGTWFITMSSDEKRVLGIRPANGIFKGKVDKFVANEGDVPTPRTKVGEDWAYEYFVVLVKLSGGNVEGMIVPVMLRYHFGEADEDGKSVVAFSHPKSKYTPPLAEFCDVTGVWERGPMPYKDNVLPMMEKRILREDRTFQLVIKNGYADSFLALDNDEGEPETAKPTKAAKKNVPVEIHPKEDEITPFEVDEETLPEE